VTEHNSSNAVVMMISVSRTEGESDI